VAWTSEETAVRSRAARELLAARSHHAAAAKSIFKRASRASRLARSKATTKRGLADTRRRYNRRGLNLHRAAQKIAAEGWPDDLTELPGIGQYTAAAVANFALGRDVLPVDTNVSRIQERTGHQFSPAAGQALMDLGATVCLARIPRCGLCPLAPACPSRGRRYEALRKQSRFEGSFRQRRARTLRLVAESERPLSDLDREAVESLARDGLVQVASCGTFVTLP
jgi:adenine-specific DNA glycosylase